ncbi:hypothetical protein [Opitutus terrae]|nr:hypothetical protein [Opitutus terrae]
MPRRVAVFAMTWKELRDFLERENEKMRPGETARIESLHQATEPATERRARRLAGEYPARTAINQACLHFAEHGHWPSMDPEATLYAHDRWIWAMWFSGWLDEMSPLQEEHSREEWLEWLLVESWHELGSWRWRTSQESS